MSFDPPMDWVEKSLGECIELKRGYDLPKRLRKTGDVPIISSSGPSGWHDTAKIKAPGVVTGRYGTIGKVFYVNEDFWPLNTALYVRDFKGSNPRFVSYFLKTIRWDQYTDKAAVPGVNRNHVHLEKVRWPPLSEQRRIANVLATLDNKIDSNEKINLTLGKMSQALFRSWFIDFDHNPTNLVDSVLGSIPKGWRVGTLEEVADLNPRSWTKKKHPDAIEYVDLSNTSHGRILNTTHYSWPDAPSRARRVLEPWDTIFGCVRPRNRSYALVHEEGLTGSTGFAVLRAKSPTGVAFVYLSTITDTNVARLTRVADGAAYPAVRPHVVHETPCVIPPDSVLADFDRIVRPLLEQIGRNEKESRTLAELRDTLLPKLTSGEIRVPEVETTKKGAT